MMNDPLPLPDHVARYCKPTTIDAGEVQASAFLLREGEPYLSTNWLEQLDQGELETQLRLLREVCKTKGLRLATTGLLARFNVGDTKQVVIRECNKHIPFDVLHKPEDNDSSHSGMCGIVDEVELVAELLVEAIMSTHSTR